MESGELEDYEGVVDNDVLENSQYDLFAENSKLDEGGCDVRYPQCGYNCFVNCFVLMSGSGSTLGLCYKMQYWDWVWAAVLLVL